MDTKAPTILFTWECGGGLGHVMQMRPLAEDLARRGGRVFAAVRDPSRAGRVFDRDVITTLAAPFKAAASTAPFNRPATFAHLLHNVGWDDDAGLGGMVDAWRALFELVRPQMAFVNGIRDIHQIITVDVTLSASHLISLQYESCIHGLRRLRPEHGRYPQRWSPWWSALRQLGDVVWAGERGGIRWIDDEVHV